MLAFFFLKSTQIEKLKKKWKTTLMLFSTFFNFSFKKKSIVVKTNQMMPHLRAMSSLFVFMYEYKNKTMKKITKIYKLQTNL